MSRRRVTFSRNFTLSLSRTCRCYCKYCAFKTHQAHMYSPAEVERFLEQAVRRNAKELQVLRRATVPRPARHRTPQCLSAVNSFEVVVKRPEKARLPFPEASWGRRTSRQPPGVWAFSR